MILVFNFNADSTVEHGSNEYYIEWLIAMLGVSALVGFVLGIGTFIFSFMKVHARSSTRNCSLGALAFILCLATLSHFLVLQYPHEILQSYVDHLWPLQ